MLHGGKSARFNPGHAQSASESMPHVWLQVISGGIDVLGEILNAGDGLAIENQADGFRIQGLSNESRLLAFRLNEPTSSQSS